MTCIVYNTIFTTRMNSNVGVIVMAAMEMSSYVRQFLAWQLGELLFPANTLVM